MRIMGSNWERFAAQYGDRLPRLIHEDGSQSIDGFSSGLQTGFPAQTERSFDGGDGIDVESSLQDADHRVVVAGQQHSVLALDPVDRCLTFREDDHVIDDVEVPDEQAAISVKKEGVASPAASGPVPSPGSSINQVIAVPSEQPVVAI